LSESASADLGCRQPNGKTDAGIAAGTPAARKAVLLLTGP